MKIKIKNGLNGPYVLLRDLCIFLESLNSSSYTEHISYEYFEEMIKNSSFEEGDSIEHVLDLLEPNLEEVVCGTCNGESMWYDEDREEDVECEYCDGAGYINMSDLYEHILNRIKHINLNPNLRVFL